MIKIFFDKVFKSKIDYHERRLDSNKFTKQQKQFSDGYLSGAYMVEIYQGGDNSASHNARLAYRLIKDPQATGSQKQQAKGLVAALYDYKKTIPADMDVWGRKIKTRRK